MQCKDDTNASHCLPSLTRYAGCYAGSKGLTYKGLMSAPPTCGKRVGLSRAAGEKGASRILESAIRAIVCSHCKQHPVLMSARALRRVLFCFRTWLLLTY